jgi:hypothetical protein
MVEVAWNERRASVVYFFPAITKKNLSLALMEKNLVFPFMAVKRSVAAGIKLENPHAEVFGTVIFSDKKPGGNAFGHIVVNPFGCFIRVMQQFHDLSPSEFIHKKFKWFWL